MSGFSDFIKSVLVGLPWGAVYPPKPAPPPPAIDGRTAGLRILAQFISELVFYREDEPGKPPIAFQVPIERIHIEWPDSDDATRELPVIALISGGQIDYQFLGLGASIDEDSRDVHGKNTVLQAQSDNVETLWIDVLCKSKQERRAIREGLTIALNPTELMQGIRFLMPDYYNQMVTFEMWGTTLIEGEDSVKNRRAMRIEVHSVYTAVVLINIEPLTPVMSIAVDTEDGVTEIVLDVPPQEPDRVALEGAEGEPTVPFEDRP